jgi:hypothetical protein
LVLGLHDYLQIHLRSDNRPLARRPHFQRIENNIGVLRRRDRLPEDAVGNAVDSDAAIARISDFLQGDPLRVPRWRAERAGPSERRRNPLNDAL